MTLSRDDEDAKMHLTSQHEPQAEPQIGYRIISLGVPERFDQRRLSKRRSDACACLEGSREEVQLTFGIGGVAAPTSGSTSLDVRSLPALALTPP
jgi:hypothetical protein